MREEDYRTQDDDDAGGSEQCQGCAMHQTLATGAPQFRTPPLVLESLVSAVRPAGRTGGTPQPVQKSGECQDQFEQGPLSARSVHSTLEASRTRGGLGLNELSGHKLWELHLRPVHDLTSLDS